MYKSSVLLSLCNTDDGLWTVTYSRRHHWCLFHQWNTHNLTNCTKFSCFIENIDFLVMIAVLLVIISIISNSAEWICFMYVFIMTVEGDHSLFILVLSYCYIYAHFEQCDRCGTFFNYEWFTTGTVDCSRFTVCQSYGLWVNLGNASSLS